MQKIKLSTNRRPRTFKISTHPFPSQDYDHALSEMVAKKQFGHHFIPFIATAAATLEAKLNDYLTMTSSEKHVEDQREIADSLLSMSLRGKLDFFVPFITDHKFVINKQGHDYQNLAKLISLRNKIMHRKEHYRSNLVESNSNEEFIEIDAFLDTFGRRKRSTKIPSVLKKGIEKTFRESIKSGVIENIDEAKARKIFDAIQNMDSKFYYLHEAGKLKQNEFVLKSKRP